MQYRNRETEEVVDDASFRHLFPESGFPDPIPYSDLDERGFDPVIGMPPPQPAYGQIVLFDGVKQFPDAKWYTTWKVVDLDPTVFAEKKAADQNEVWLRIKAERDHRKSGGIKLTIHEHDYWFWTDDPSRSQYAMLDSKIRRANLADDYLLDNWKTMSGEYVPFTVAVLYQVIDAGIHNESVLFHVAEAHRQAMLAEENPFLYDFSTNWPEMFSDTH